MKKAYFLFLLVLWGAGQLVGQTTYFPGPVGIGTMSPAHPLHINAEMNDRARFQFGTALIDLPSYGLSTQDYSNSAGLFVSGSDGLLMTGTGLNLRFVTNNGSYLERMRITSIGNVGIGTKEPTRKFHVYGGDWTARVQNQFGYIDFGPANGSGAHIYTDLDQFFFNKEIRITSNPARVSAYEDNPFKINVGGSDRMHISNNGNIGIGTDTPSNKLEVNGTIRAKEIKLEASNWPDYVFEEGYELMPLEEVKVHIDQKGHLPGLKPAIQYETEGVHIMELNIKLLEKVEELTLYMIDLKEEIDSLNLLYGPAKTKPIF